MTTIPQMTEMKPYDSYRGSKADCAQSIPRHWKTLKLRNTLSSHTSGVWGEEPDGENDLLCIRVADFDRQRGRVRNDAATVRAVTPAEKQGRIIQSGDLLLEKSGGGEKQPVGTVVLYDHETEATCSNFIQMLVVRNDIDPIYLSFIHSTLYAQGVNRRSIKQTTGIQNIDIYTYLSEYVPIPPPEEQAAIVRFLDHADGQIQRYIAAKERLIALLEEQRQGVIHQAVTRGLDPDVKMKDSGMEGSEKIPKHWEVCRLRNLVTEVTTGSRGWSSYAANSGPIFIRIANLNRGSLALRFNNIVRLNLPKTSEAERACVEPGDLLVSVTAYIGSIGVVPEHFEEAYVSQHVARCKPRAGVSSQWLGNILLSKIGQAHGQISLYGGAKDGLSLDDVKNYPIILPPTSEQMAIVEHINKITGRVSDKIAQSKRQIELLSEYRTRLIADVVTGQLDVRDVTL